VLRSCIAALVLCGAPGCSLLFVEGPPPDHAHMQQPFDCTSSNAAPIVDTAFAVLYALSAATVSARTEASAEHRDLTPSVLMIGVATLEGVSAVRGFVTTSKCRAAEQQWVGRQRARPREARCGSDADCKADRVCELGACVAPRMPALTPQPASEAQP
jgi:hypothetical protein